MSKKFALRCSCHAFDICLWHSWVNRFSSTPSLPRKSHVSCVRSSKSWSSLGGFVLDFLRQRFILKMLWTNWTAVGNAKKQYWEQVIHGKSFFCGKTWIVCNNRHSDNWYFLHLSSKKLASYSYFPMQSFMWLKSWTNVGLVQVVVVQIWKLVNIALRTVVANLVQSQARETLT